MPWNRSLIIGVLLVLAALSWWRLQPTDESVRRSRLLMGTVVEIIATGEQVDQAIEDAFAEMTRLDKLLSRHQKESDVTRLSSKINSGKVASETAEVVALGLEIALKSDGAFDMTLGRLKSLWGLDQENPSVPVQAAIAAALEGIGPKALSLDKQTLTKQNPSLQLDLGGIAKGYIVDRAIGILKEQGVSSAAVNAGGDMFLLGNKSQRPWHIGIQHPRNTQAVLATVAVSDRAVVTSGDYERFFEQDGVRYHHIFDPRNGRPSRACQSVTIITDSVALGDALATAVFVLGPEAGLKLLADFPQAEGLIVAADGSLRESPGWASYVVKR